MYILKVPIDGDGFFGHKSLIGCWWVLKGVWNTPDGAVKRIVVRLFCQFIPAG
jgi:hypothetical protein